MSEGPFIDPGDPPLPFAEWDSDPLLVEDHAEPDYLRNVAESIRRAAEARQLRDQGQAQVIEAADVQLWRALFIAEVERLARMSPSPFTSDDALDAVGLPPRPNAVGAAMTGLARLGVIRRIGYVTSSRPSRHAAVVAQWQGVGHD